jgi:predicted  nucleic acid-binding Zn-ribbon protein
VRELTVDEKRRVRGLLDANFDDAAGIYLDGYSDQRIATEADVPRACVRQLREASYGPIKRHPELDAIEAQIAEARAVAETARQEIATAQATAAKAESAIKDATDRLKALSQRMGVAA